MRRRRATWVAAGVLAAGALVGPIAIGGCSSDDSSGPAPTCGPGTDIPCIDGALPDSLIFQYDAPTQYADVILPDTNYPVDAADASEPDGASPGEDAADASDAGSTSDAGDAAEEG